MRVANVAQVVERRVRVAPVWPRNLSFIKCRPGALRSARRSGQAGGPALPLRCAQRAGTERTAANQPPAPRWVPREQRPPSYPAASSGQFRPLAPLQSRCVSQLEHGPEVRVQLATGSDPTLLPESGLPASFGGSTRRIPYAPFTPAWLHGNRMVARVRCARNAGDAHRVRTSVRASSSESPRATPSLVSWTCELPSPQTMISRKSSSGP
jgi:hypothetical protein